MTFSEARPLEHTRSRVRVTDENASRYVTGGRFKRALDFCISSAAILAVWPAMLGIAGVLWIGGNSVFALRDRIGLSGVEFNEIQFNTDTTTRLGRFLQTSGIAALPMLLNVMKGEMSIVGPEPKQLDGLKSSTRFASLYLQVRPGLTGRWRVSPESALGKTSKMRLDRSYIQNGTLWDDVSIVLKTPFAFYLNA